MNRRGVLGILGIGAAAGPVVAKEAVKQWTTTSSPPIGYPGELYDANPVQENPLETLNYYRKDYDYLTGNKQAWITDQFTREFQEIVRYGNFSHQIDPDIQAMKSFSQTSKIRLHVQRRAEKKYEENRNSLATSIKRMMERIV